MQVVLSKTKNVGMENISTKMDLHMKVSGSMTYMTDKENVSIAMGANMKVNG